MENARITAATHRSQGIANSEKNIEEKAAAKKRKLQQKEAVAKAEARAVEARLERSAKLKADPEYQSKQLLKEGEAIEKKKPVDFEAALAKYVEALTGFAALGVERPNLTAKVADINKWIDDEATC